MWIVFGILMFLVFWFISSWNKLVALENNRDAAFADIDVQLKQRYDLIPQLVDVVKGYMNHEKDLLLKITEARSKALNAKTINEKIEADNELTSAMGALNIQVEAYPDLKASQNFMQLQQEIADIENKLAAARRYFNSATKELNTAIESIPTNIVAGFRKMVTQPMFDLGQQKREELDKPQKINFN